ncbi:MAG: PQQ-binding-like beta-propeller repeat protein [Planctomycetota bacterium]|nr:PQQ-binding-like beta-propeller repeat protein [Planctomycetota bacterium]
MDHHGLIAPGSVANLFKELAEQNATGILSLTSSMGEKRIAIDHGQITVVSDRLAERARIGDLLVIRGKLTDERLEEALEAQRQIEPRPKLGELLVNRKYVIQDDIDAALKFQLEEELLEVFDWRDGEFDFDIKGSAVDLIAVVTSEGEQGEQRVHTLKVNPRALIEESASRLAEWETIRERLPTPYQCFEMTEKGNELYRNAQPGNQRILRLIREGRTMESVIKLSAQGRFQVCKGVIRFLDDGWIAPYPTSKLRFLASEHRVQGRFTDALNIYRRLIESTRDEADREELKRMLDQTAEAKLRAELYQDQQKDAVSHKKAAESYLRRQKLRQGVLVAIALGLFSYAIYTYILMGRRNILPDEFLAAIDRAAAARIEQRYGDEIEIWEEYAASLDDPNSELSEQVLKRYEEARTAFRRQLDYRFDEAYLLEEKGQFNDARAAYENLRKKYPDSHLGEPLEQSLKRVNEKLEGQRATREMGDWRKKLDAALALEQDRRLQAAFERLTEVSEKGLLDPEMRQRASEALERLRAIQAQARAAFEQAEDLLRNRDAARALDKYGEARGLWPELPIAEQAAGKLAELLKRRGELRDALNQARIEENRGALQAAIDQLVKIPGSYPEFGEETKDLAERVKTLAAQLKEAQELLAKAQAAEEAQNLDAAYKLYEDLLRKHRAFLGAQEVTLPAVVETDPPGAAVKVDGRAAGVSPLVLRVPVSATRTLAISHEGYAPVERIVRALTTEDLRVRIALGRAALRQVNLRKPCFAPPVVLGGTLLVASGATLNGLGLDGQLKWTNERVVDDSAGRRPDSDGSGREVFVDDRSWWYFREPPQAWDPAHFFVGTRQRKLWKLDYASGKGEVLLELPVETVGGMLLRRDTLLAGKTILALVCADGSVRAYDAEHIARPLWQEKIDPAPAPNGSPLAGALYAGRGVFATVSRGGELVGWRLEDGRKAWTLSLGERLRQSGLPGGDHPWAEETLCPFVTAAGGLIVADLRSGRKTWSYSSSDPRNRLEYAVPGPKGLYALTKNGVLRKYPRSAGGENPRPDWEKPLDDLGPPPALNGEHVFVASKSGLVYALDGEGKQRWRFQCGGEPTHLTVAGEKLYVVTKEGQVVLLNAD